MKQITHKKTDFADVIFDANMKVAIAFGTAMIALLLVYIALFK